MAGEVIEFGDKTTRAMSITTELLRKVGRELCSDKRLAPLSEMSGLLPQARYYVARLTRTQW